jgi:hypothetical protein
MLKLPAGVTAVAGKDETILRIQIMRTSGAAPEVLTAKKEEGGAAKK